MEPTDGVGGLDELGHRERQRRPGRGARWLKTSFLGGVALLAGFTAYDALEPDADQLWLRYYSAYPLVAQGERVDDEDLVRAMLEACGAWGGTISAREAGRIFWIAGRRISEDDPQKADDYAQQLAAVWTPDALTHVFCGEPGERGLGGMHWTPRWETTRNKWKPVRSCLSTDDSPLRSEEVNFVEPVSGDVVHGRCPKSHAPDVTAQYLLGLGMIAAFSPDRVCVVPQGAGFVFVVVHDQGQVRTVYPRRTVADDPLCFQGEGAG